ncbi:MAG: hypothetical protein V4608_03410 [Bacteroidota bacterium]
MSRDEAKNMPLREMVRQSITMMEEHKRESTSFRDSTTKQLSKLNTTIATIETHGIYTKETLESHETDLGKLKASEQRRKGFMAGLSFLGIASAIDLIRRILS